MYIGVDPGVTGAMAAVAGAGGVVSVHRFSRSSTADTHAWLVGMQGGGCRAILERVGASPQMGRTSAFTFGRAYGEIRALLVAVGVPFVEVAPSVWQSALGCQKRKKSEPQAGHKRRLRERAQELFPGKVTTADLADALLLAEYGRRTGGGR